VITIALPKGRLMDESLNVLSSCGITVEVPSSRKLFFFDKSNRYRFLIVYCKMVVAGRDKSCLNEKKTIVRVATKFVNIAKEYFLKKGINAEIIKLYGSIELAPLLGLSDCIVDIVSTGRTLKENGLIVIEEIFESTAILVANKVSFYTKHIPIRELLNSLK